MPLIKVPPLPSYDIPEPMVAAPIGEPRQPDVHLWDLPGEVIRDLSVGDDIRLVIKGSVRSLESREDERSGSRASLGLYITHVGAEPLGNDFTQMADEMDAG